MWRVAICGCLAAALAGCISQYEVSAAMDTAEFSLAMANDSQWTTLRTTYVSVFKDEECTRSELGVRAGSKAGNDSQVTTAPRKILANEKFVFTGTYLDARFAQNRKCAVTAVFVPRKNRRYRADLTVTDDVAACRVSVYDTTADKDEPVAFTIGKNLCEDEGKADRANGQPVAINYNANVTVISGGGRHR